MWVRLVLDLQMFGFDKIVSIFSQITLKPQSFGIKG